MRAEIINGHLLVVPPEDVHVVVVDYTLIVIRAFVVGLLLDPQELQERVEQLGVDLLGGPVQIRGEDVCDLAYARVLVKPEECVRRMRTHQHGHVGEVFRSNLVDPVAPGERPVSFGLVTSRFVGRAGTGENVAVCLGHPLANTTWNRAHTHVEWHWPLHQTSVRFVRIVLEL